MHGTTLTHPRSKRQAVRGRLALLGAIVALAAIWLFALPQLALHPTVADHIAQQERLGIDPSAMFYTELEIAPAIAHRAERRREAEQHCEAEQNCAAEQHCEAKQHCAARE